MVGVVGAVIGQITAPEAFIVGLIDDRGELTVLGRTTPLSPGQSSEIGRLLVPSERTHPWTDRIGSGQFGGGPTAITKVEPELIAEVSADTAQVGGRRRHALKFIRIRLD